MGRLFGGMYRLGLKIGAGSWGEIFIGNDVQTGDEVAIKLESVSARIPKLMYESTVYKILGGGEGVPRVRWYGADGDYNVMVMDLLGPSLQDLFSFCRERFSLKTVLMLADQMLNRMEYIHANGFVHRDVKPDNFLIGLGPAANQVHLIDFGLARVYRDPATAEHLPYAEGRHITGTARFSSVNAHAGVEHSRRDDLEAVGHVLIYLCRGSLPWQGQQGVSPEERHRRCLDIKRSTPISALCEHLPSEFSRYIEYCRGLGFEETPDYGFLRGMLRDLFVREGYRYDFVFDWTLAVSEPVEAGMKAGALEEDAMPALGSAA